MEKFIDSVREYPCLWDVNHKHYKDLQMMDRAWAQVAEYNEILNANAAKHQWKKLRDSFRDSLKRQNDLRSGQGASSCKPYRYQKQMEFLIPYFQNNRKTVSNYDFLPHPEQQPSCSLNAPHEVEVEVVEEDSQPISQLPKSPETTPKTAEKRKRNEEVLSVLKEMSNKREKRAAEREKERSSLQNDSLLNFFNYMHSVVKKFPEDLQIDLKQKFFSLVAEAEVALASSASAHQNVSQDTQNDHNYY